MRQEHPIGRPPDELLAKWIKEANKVYANKPNTLGKARLVLEYFATRAAQWGAAKADE